MPQTGIVGTKKEVFTLDQSPIAISTALKREWNDGSRKSSRGTYADQSQRSHLQKRYKVSPSSSPKFALENGLDHEERE